MTASLAWLPPLVLLGDSKGNWPAYEEVLYEWFRKDFLDSRPSFPGKRVALKRHPLVNGKEATFWHFISEGAVERERTPDIRRCERIRWPRPIIEAFNKADQIVWWRNKRWGKSGAEEERILLALPDFSYVIVLADRGEYILPWTAYPVEKPHGREKLKREFEAFRKAESS